MLTEVMEHFRLVKEFPKAGYYETDHQKQMFKDIKAANPFRETGCHNGNYWVWQDDYFTTLV